jgi:membrane-bound metal-dependent hydrolase YbcI (DUF457 family)
MTPFGHASVSYLAGMSSNQIWLPAIILGGILPDIDFLFIFHPAFNHIHRMFTHNLLFVVFTSVLIGVWAKKRPKKWIILSLLMGGILHLLIDACLDSNPSNGIGIPFFWPFVDTYFSPINLARPMENSTGWREPVKMLRSSFYGLIWELPLYFFSILLFRKSKKNA